MAERLQLLQIHSFLYIELYYIHIMTMISMVFGFVGLFFDDGYGKIMAL
jgi:hypothetical protein